MKNTRTTADPVSASRLRDDVSLLLDTIAAGGVAIAPLDVAYAVNACTEAGIRAIYAAKKRSYEKPGGLFANVAMSRAIHVMEDWKHDLAETITREENIPFSIVAPFRVKHEFFSRVEPFVMASSTKAGTLDMLLNAGQFHDEIARQSWQRGMPVFGSSANTSLQGSKYRYQDIEAPVREVASVYFDYGISKYANPEGHSSTIIDFRDFSVIRVGVVFDRVASAFRKHGKVALKLP
ncbi:Sua5/YciO/YrdC/YwlC family protein [Candidatus Foliamicus sp.]